ncbi:PTS sugar transporter subunit IIA [Fictibacillus phosphorivorans]|uniref:PTS sugar transporter subunit IIA n=1 Tax=Fictibacillus phosphorivorans TaxID=1221500 RepID=UPI00203EBA2F|nr:PTS glucose transporter subunit IIA [Fictibacillus phosphorivorans]MCM3720073.1 PTS glucose transporter subunit IIA [Fictibacillus phosphorivorans]MCM3777763.1 PTS glucose transporter subunit IIA [Fictibacillus phosphorivorans]
MFNKLFGKKEVKKEETIVAPLTGKIVSIEEVPDPTFSQKMMGDGIAIEPTEGVVVSPVDGEVVQFFHTKHAIGIQSKSGAEILIHVGLETVNMNGEGFDGHVKVGDKVRAGDKLLSFDLDLIKEKAASTVTPIVITNGDAVESLDKRAASEATKGETSLLQIKMK